MFLSPVILVNTWVYRVETIGDKTTKCVPVRSLNECFLKKCFRSKNESILNCIFTCRFIFSSCPPLWHHLSSSWNDPPHLEYFCPLLNVKWIMYTLINFTLVFPSRGLMSIILISRRRSIMWERVALSQLGRPRWFNSDIPSLEFLFIYFLSLIFYLLSYQGFLLVFVHSY